MAVVVAETFLGLLERYDPSFLRTLSADPDEERFAPNKTSREVKQGHYVRVAPTPLPQPTYVAHSRHLLATLGVVNQAEAQSEAFVRFFESSTLWMGDSVRTQHFWSRDDIKLSI